MFGVGGIGAVLSGGWAICLARTKEVWFGWADIPVAQRLASQPDLRLKRVLGGTLELFSCARQSRANGADGDVQYVGCVLIAAVGFQGGVHRLAHFRRQVINGAQGVLQAAVDLKLPIQVVVFFLSMPQRFIKFAMHGFGIHAPEVVANQVLRDAAHPGAERGVTAEALAVAPGLQVRQLQKIIRIFGVKYALVNEAPEFFLLVVCQVMHELRRAANEVS